jgi:hypothetical protein
VAGCVGDVERAAARRDLLASGKRPHPIRWNRFDLAPERVHVRTVQPCRAGEELRRIGEVPRTPLVDEHLDLGIRRDEGARRTGMVEVDVRQQEPADVANSYPLLPERLEQRFERRRGSRIDEHHPARVIEHCRGDNARTPEKVEIDVVHPASECAPVHVGRDGGEAHRLRFDATWILW